MLIAAASLAACARRTKATWSPAESPPPPDPEQMQAVSTPPHEALGSSPVARNYTPPPGARLVATHEGPARPAPSVESELLPAELWIPALPEKTAAAMESETLSDDVSVDGALESDVDGDGSIDSILLVRPLEPFRGETYEHTELLIALTKQDPTRLRLLASRRFAPLRHAAPGGPARSCHADWKLAGSLRAKSESILVYEDRGVGCAVMGPGGGFDRSLYVVDAAGFARPREPVGRLILARGRLGAGKARDRYEGVAYALDVDGDGKEELIGRGIAFAHRSCAEGGASWREELAWRVYRPDGRVEAMWEDRLLPLEDGELPESLTKRHELPCE